MGCGLGFKVLLGRCVCVDYKMLAQLNQPQPNKLMNQFHYYKTYEQEMEVYSNQAEIYHGVDVQPTWHERFQA